MSGQISWLIWFNLFVVAMLILDQAVFHRRAHVVSMKEALAWSFAWIALALLFNLGIYFYKGPKPALEFLTGYIIEQSLSVDNLFVFILIFSYFKVPSQYQHKILFWGILGAQVMRGIFIFAGVALIDKFHWIIYLFGALLIMAGFKMLSQKDKEIHPERNPVLKIFRRFFPVTRDYEGSSFFAKKEGVWFATPLFIVLLTIETTDLIFAVDSIPAILAITRDPFIVYTSNVFAILGLRALYFVLARIMQLFHYLNYGLCAILVFVGVKMLIGDFYHIPVAVALMVVVATLSVSIIASLILPKPAGPENKESPS
ncbi:MAG TPA: TerC family protein [Candidatus Omnitrophota bacterium]|nr:TerC family protein [Candidatus Omnitrophota bacterium]HPD84712.1 TerC family protein [Candidatus Omnitrophota bacterium]HRZ03570.1 TerC family protein [Candidatus Omnitrophota bacterium]